MLALRSGVDDGLMLERRETGAGALGDVDPATTVVLGLFLLFALVRLRSRSR